MINPTPSYTNPAFNSFETDMPSATTTSTQTVALSALEENVSSTNSIAQKTTRDLFIEGLNK